MSDEKNLEDELKDITVKLKTQVDREIAPMADDDPNRLRLGWVVTEYGPDDPMPLPPGDHQGTDYSDLFLPGASGKLPLEVSRRRGSTVIDVLPFLIGKPWNNLALNWIRSLRTDDIRVTYGGVNLDSRHWRVTIHLNKDNTIRKIEQEIEVGLIGCYHGHHLELVTKDPTYKGEPPRAYFNPKGITKLTMS